MYSYGITYNNDGQNPFENIVPGWHDPRYQNQSISGILICKYQDKMNPNVLHEMKVVLNRFTIAGLKRSVVFYLDRVEPARPMVQWTLYPISCDYDSELVEYQSRVYRTFVNIDNAEVDTTSKKFLLNDKSIFNIESVRKYATIKELISVLKPEADGSVLVPLHALENPIEALQSIPTSFIKDIEYQFDYFPNDEWIEIKLIPTYIFNHIESTARTQKCYVAIRAYKDDVSDISIPKAVNELPSIQSALSPFKDMVESSRQIKLQLDHVKLLATKVASAQSQDEMQKCLHELNEAVDMIEELEINFDQAKSEFFKNDFEKWADHHFPISTPIIC